MKNLQFLENHSLKSFHVHNGCNFAYLLNASIVDNMYIKIHPWDGNGP